jgi:hypothetical protein
MANTLQDAGACFGNDTDVAINVCLLGIYSFQRYATLSTNGDVMKIGKTSGEVGNLESAFQMWMTISIFLSRCKQVEEKYYIGGACY